MLGRAAAALLAGVLVACSFAPTNIPELAPVGLGLLFALWYEARPAAAALWGFIFGLGLFGVDLHWVHIGIVEFGNGPLWVGYLADFLVITLLALPTLGVGYLCARLFPAASWSRLLAVPLLWTGLTLARAYLFSGFPWLALGYGQTSGLFAPLAPIFGVFGLGFVLLLCAALPVLALFKKSLAAAGGCLLLLGLLLASRECHWTKPAGAPRTVALVQGVVSPKTKFDPEQRLEDLRRYWQLSQSRHEDIIIWPESAIAFTRPEVTRVLRSMSGQLASRGQALVTGLLDEDAAGVMYNAATVLGRGSGNYHKHHLMPFGEYLPWRSLFSWFGRFVAIPYSDLGAGPFRQPNPRTLGIPVGVSICFEAAFGRQVRTAMPAAQYLINISDDSWFGDSPAAAQHLQMNQMRALELGRDLARAANYGITAVIAFDGKIRAQLPWGIGGVLSSQIVPRQGLTPYARWGLRPLGLLSMLYAIVLALFYFIDLRHARTLSSRRHRARNSEPMG